LKTCSKIVEEKTTKKVTASSSTVTQPYDKKGEKHEGGINVEHTTSEGIFSGVTSTLGSATSAFSGFFGKHTKETANELVSAQKDDGSFEISATIVKELEVESSDKLVSSAQKYTTNEKLKEADSSWWSTAITLTYLKDSATQYGGEYADKYEKAKKYLSTQIGNAELEKELIESSEKYVVDNTRKRTTINSELIVVGAACYAKCKCTKHFTRTKEAFSKEKANEIIAQYATEEVERLFSSNSTCGNKDDIIKRAKQAASFIIDEYIVKTGGKEC